MAQGPSLRARRLAGQCACRSAVCVARADRESDPHRDGRPHAGHRHWCDGNDVWRHAAARASATTARRRAGADGEALLHLAGPRRVDQHQRSRIARLARGGPGAGQHHLRHRRLPLRAGSSRRQRHRRPACERDDGLVGILADAGSPADAGPFHRRRGSAPRHRCARGRPRPRLLATALRGQSRDRRPDPRRSRDSVHDHRRRATRLPRDRAHRYRSLAPAPRLRG